VFHGFGQAKFANGGSILGSSQFTTRIETVFVWFSETVNGTPLCEYVR